MARFEVSTHETTDIAAAGGAPDALFQLGLMYCAGRDVELDLVSAHKWFNLAAHARQRRRQALPHGDRPRDVQDRDRRGPAPGARVAGAALSAATPLSSG